MMPREEFNPAQMDAAAEVAATELRSLDPNSVKLIANWFAKHYLKAGHKRLGRVLVAASKMNL